MAKRCRHPLLRVKAASELSALGLLFLELLHFRREIQQAKAAFGIATQAANCFIQHKHVTAPLGKHIHGNRQNVNFRKSLARKFTKQGAVKFRQFSIYSSSLQFAKAKAKNNLTRLFSNDIGRHADFQLGHALRSRRIDGKLHRPIRLTTKEDFGKTIRRLAILAENFITYD